MARPKATEATETTDGEGEAPEKRKVVIVRKKSSEDWMGMLKQAAESHWRKLKITIRIREKLHAGKPAQLDAALAMLKARGLDDAIEAVNTDDPNELADAAERAVNEGLCEFHRRADKPGIWWPANHLKAMLKENWSVLGYRDDARPRSKRKEQPVVDADQLPEGAEPPKAKKLRGSRGALAEGVFVVSCDPADRDWLYLGEKADGVDTSVSHHTGPKGPQSSIKRNEFMSQPTLEFEIWLAHAIVEKLPDESLADTLLHAQEHGVGANRSQGTGRFDILKIEEL